MRSMSYTFAAAAVFDILFVHCIVNVEANFDVLLLVIVHRRSGWHWCRCDRSDAAIAIVIACAVVLEVAQRQRRRQRLLLRMLLVLIVLAVCRHWCKGCER